MYALYILIGILLAAFVYYLYTVVTWIIRWNQFSFPKVEGFSNGVSIIIPFRNEKRNFEKNIEMLIHQVKASSDVELIFINDHSTDGSELLLRQWTDEKIKCINAVDNGKKRAVQQGVHAAKFDYMLTLDADILIKEDWLEGVLDATKFKRDFIILPLVVAERSGWFKRFQYTEFLSLFAATGGSALTGKPLMCNGAHLLFRKNFYLKNESKLRFDVSSGDDMFLMESLEKDDSWMYHFDRRLLAQMEPEERLRTFIRQRIRWAGKTKNLKSFHILFFGGVVVVIQLAFWALAVACATTECSFGWLGIFFGVKFFIDFLLLKVSSRVAGLNSSFIDVFILALVYPIYAFIIPLLSLFVTPEWKGRKIST
ncbi:MAG: glycosyltransferase [Flavobacteriales bacterium]|jgi:biofilm PGA synthesis N-glycosyltransferase PgaC